MIDEREERGGGWLLLLVLFGALWLLLWVLKSADPD